MLPASQVEELWNLLGKGLRATQLYLPNNPVYQRAVDNIREVFRRIWQATDDLVFTVGEGELRWEDQVVYQHSQKSENVAWTLFKDGIRSLTFKPGVEDEEVVRFLGILQKARTLQADAADDLLTLLWEQDFHFVAYTFRELISDNAVPIEPGETAGAPASSAGGGPRVVEREAPQAAGASEGGSGAAEAAPAAGLVSTDDFDTTLYFLEDKEVEYLQQEVDREYSQDLRRNVLTMLFDLLELQTYSTVRAELLSILENFIPYLLAAGDFRSVAYILRETRVVLQRARELIPEHRTALETLPTRLSQPEALAQLLQSLDEATVHPTEEELGELFQELRAEALPTLMAWLPKLANERVRGLVMAAAERLAQINAPEVLKALASDDHAAQLEMVRLAGRLKLPGAPDGMGPLLDHGDREVKLAVVEALTAIGSPSALRLLERAIEDAERDVRIAAVKYVASRGHRNAFDRISAAVLGGKLRDTDLTEKIAFFEAYGTMAGAAGIAPLEKILEPKGGLLGKRGDPESRACAAMALGKIGRPESRAVLERARDDKEALVRNAVSRALRESGA